MDLRLAAGLLLCWLAGAGLVLALPRPRPLWGTAGGFAWTLGAGWFAGALLAAVVLRATAALTGAFSLGALAVLQAVAVLAGCAVAWRRERPELPRALADGWRTLSGGGLRMLPRLLWLGLLGWIAVRLVLLGHEALGQPVFTWQAWSQIASKARVWFGLRTMVPFVDAPQWLASAGGAWFDAAPTVPGVAPLQAVLANLWLGRYDDAAMNAPWWLSAAALPLAVYGGLRHARVGPLVALLGTWVATSLPLLDVQVGLAGGADLHAACFMTLAGLALVRWQQEAGLADALLVLTFGAAVAATVPAGVVGVVALLLAGIAATWPLWGARVAFGALGAACLAVFAVSRMQGGWPGLAPLVFTPRGGAFVEEAFLFDNFHLLGLGWLAAAIHARRSLLAGPVGPLTVVVSTLGTYVAALSFFPALRGAGGTWESPTRAALLMAPLLVVHAMLLLRASGDIVDAGPQPASGPDPSPSVVASPAA